MKLHPEHRDPPGAHIIGAGSGVGPAGSRAPCPAPSALSHKSVINCVYGRGDLGVNSQGPAARNSKVDSNSERVMIPETSPPVVLGRLGPPLPALCVEPAGERQPVPGRPWEAGPAGAGMAGPCPGPGACPGGCLGAEGHPGVPATAHGLWLSNQEVLLRPTTFPRRAPSRPWSEIHPPSPPPCP